MNKRDTCIAAVTQELRLAGIGYRITHGGKRQQARCGHDGDTV